MRKKCVYIQGLRVYIKGIKAGVKAKTEHLPIVAIHTLAHESVAFSAREFTSPMEIGCRAHYSHAKAELALDGEPACGLRIAPGVRASDVVSTRAQISFFDPSSIIPAAAHRSSRGYPTRRGLQCQAKYCEIQARDRCHVACGTVQSTATSGGSLEHGLWLLVASYDFRYALHFFLILVVSIKTATFVFCATRRDITQYTYVHNMWGQLL